MFEFLFSDKESLQKEAIRRMAVKILMTNASLVNRKSNATKCVVEFPFKMKSCITFIMYEAFSKQKETYA